MLLLLLLRAAASAHNISTKAERGTAYCFFLLRLRCYYCCFLCVYSIAVAAVEKWYAFYFLVGVLRLLIIFLFGGAAAAAGACAADNISTKAERGAGYCIFPPRFCPLHCDASDVYCCCCSWLILFLSFRLRCFGYGCWLRCCWDGMHAGKIQNKSFSPYPILLMLFPLRLLYCCCCCWVRICIFIFWWRCCGC